MKRDGSWVVAGMLLFFLFPAPALTQGKGEEKRKNELPAEAERPEPQAEHLQSWRYFAAVDLATPKEVHRHCELQIPAAVFGHARSDLADLRLYDAQQREIPYALRVLHGEFKREHLPAREYNRSQDGQGKAEVFLDLGARPPEYNEIEIDLAGKNFHRQFRLEGAEEEGTWKTLLDKHFITHYEYGGQRIDVRRFQLSPTRLRHLRVSVDADTEANPIQAVRIFRTIDIPAVTVTEQAQLGQREAVPAPGGPGSAWYITFGGTEPPVQQLSFEIGDAEFARQYLLEAVHENGARSHLAAGEWWRRPQSPREQMQINFREVRAKRLRLVVTDQRNPPLNIQSVWYTMAVRQLIFETKPDLAKPLKLYFGNPAAQAPGYDFARNLPLKLDPAPQRVTLEPVVENPEYVPPPRPWTERWSGLIYLALGLTSLLLLGLLGLLGREAIRRYDSSYQQEVPVQSAEQG